MGHCPLLGKELFEIDIEAIMIMISCDIEELHYNVVFTYMKNWDITEP